MKILTILQIIFSLSDIRSLFHRLQLNIILTSSEHAFPDPRIGLNTMDFSKDIFSGEVPPDKMYELTTRWGVGYNLAIALIYIYGGHLYSTFRKLVEFSKGDILILGSQMQADAVMRCLDFVVINDT